MNSGRVILINPRMWSNRSRRWPLSLLALGAVLDGKYDYEIIDANVDPDPVGTALKLIDEAPCRLVGVGAMPGPQIARAIEISAAIRTARPHVPIAWGGYFPTMYPDSAINAPYVDYLIRGQGEQTLLDLLERLPDAGSPQDMGLSAADPSALSGMTGLTFKRDQQFVHTPERSFRPRHEFPPYPYDRVGPATNYVKPSFLGRNTAVHEVSMGCRFHCNFCGVVSMFNGLTRSEPSDRLDQTLTTIRRQYGVDSMQYYDNNFFDRDETTIPTLEVLARHQLPWWCFARADVLAKYPTKTWELIRKTKLAMAFIGADAVTDAGLKKLRKGTRVDQTVEAAKRCREYGVIPEFSFILGGPGEDESEIERTLEFIRLIKRIHPQCEIILYFYSPTPQRDPGARMADETQTRLPVLNNYGPDGPELPTTPEEWTQPQWVNYVCHRDAPWLKPRTRQRVQDFARVLACRFPTVQDYSTPRWGKALLRTLAGWRYATKTYSRTWELDLARRLIPLRQPQNESL
ncbi:MAG: cobalamin-dependent protein [Planctomycetota bacterium]|nr:cobalamin-dependent protein [Planctomycetota bacterium]